MHYRTVHTGRVLSWSLTCAMACAMPGAFGEETTKSGAAMPTAQGERPSTGTPAAGGRPRGFNKPAARNAYALIMTIGDYEAGIPKLSGVALDGATAARIARSMGVPEANIVRLQDKALTLDGMRRALDDLQARLRGDDQVFVYYSGHGGRQWVQESTGARCAESLISVDGQALVDTELEQRLQQIAAKTQKTIVFLDSCHSGGATTRALSTSSPLFTAKSYIPKGLQCDKPTNVLTRNLVVQKMPGQGAANFVHIASAKDNEVSFDQPGRGGVASQAWLACLDGDAKDLDGSGGLSADEVKVCAQERINRALGGTTGYLPHHITVTGNSGMVLGYTGDNGAAPQFTRPAANASLVAPGPGASTATSARAALYDIYNNRDDRRIVTIVAPKSTLTIGKDLVQFQITSREAGYLYLLYVGSDGKTFDLLFPNQLDNDNKIEANTPLRLPRSAWQLQAQGPAGKNTVLAVVSVTPRDFSGAGMRASGPFSSAGAVAAKDIQLVTSAGAGRSSDCNDTNASRDPALPPRCDSRYGAALLSVQEVQ